MTKSNLYREQCLCNPIFTSLREGGLAGDLEWVNLFRSIKELLLVAVLVLFLLSLYLQLKRSSATACTKKKRPKSSKKLSKVSKPQKHKTIYFNMSGTSSLPSPRCLPTNQTFNFTSNHAFNQCNGGPQEITGSQQNAASKNDNRVSYCNESACPDKPKFNGQSNPPNMLPTNFTQETNY
jgi:hypothetical protein